MHLQEIAKARIYARNCRGKEGTICTNQNSARPNWQSFHRKKEGNSAEKNFPSLNYNAQSLACHFCKNFWR